MILYLCQVITSSSLTEFSNKDTRVDSNLPSVSYRTYLPYLLTHAALSFLVWSSTCPYIYECL